MKIGKTPLARGLALMTSMAFSMAALPAFAQVDETVQAFYVVSNKADGNTIVGYQKSERLQAYEMIGEFATGGMGTGDLEIPALEKDDTHPLANGDDPLISANALAATADRSHMVVVNPGNASLSLMKLNDDMTLTSVDTAASSDTFPISVAIYGDLVIAASVGKDNNHGSISLLQITGDTLEAVDGSRRDLGARPSTVAFSSDGEHIVVDELVTGKIHVFAVEGGNLSAEPSSTLDSPRSNDHRFQAIPVGLTVRGDGGDDVLIVSEARFLAPDFSLRPGDNVVKQSPLYSWQTGSLSTYQMRDDGQLSLLSADVLTGTDIEGGELANCWVALSKDGNTVYAANALSSSISTFSLDKQGHAFLKAQTAYKDDSEELFFGDLSVSRDGSELYQHVGNRGEVMIFRINRDGSLSERQTVGGLPSIGTYGMLVY